MPTSPETLAVRAIVHAASDDAADEAIAALRAAVKVGEEAPPERPVVAGRIS